MLAQNQAVILVRFQYLLTTPFAAHHHQAGPLLIGGHHHFIGLAHQAAVEGSQQIHGEPHFYPLGHQRIHQIGQAGAGQLQRLQRIRFLNFQPHHIGAAGKEAEHIGELHHPHSNALFHDHHPRYLVPGHPGQGREQVIARTGGNQLRFRNLSQTGIRRLIAHHQRGQQIGLGDNGVMLLMLNQHAVHAVLFQRGHGIPYGGLFRHDQGLTHTRFHPRQHKARQGYAPFPAFCQALVFLRQPLAEITAELHFAFTQLAKQPCRDQVAQCLLLGTKPVTALPIQYTNRPE